MSSVSVYKGIPLFADCDSTDFQLWRDLVIGHMTDKDAEMGDLFSQATAVLDRGEGCSPGSVPTALTELTAAIRASPQLDVQAKAILFKCMTAETAAQMRTRGGAMAIWYELHSQFVAWQLARGPTLTQAFESFRPEAGETVTAMCNRFDKLCGDMRAAGRAPPAIAALEHLVRQLHSERPAWKPVLMGIFTHLPSLDSLQQMTAGSVTVSSGLRQHLARLEASEARDLAPQEASAHVATAREQPATDQLAAVVQDLCREVAALRTTRDATAAAATAAPLTQSEPRPRRGEMLCHRCGRPGHSWRTCKATVVLPKGATPITSCVEPWLLDSGTTHHMSSGGSAGAAAFTSYRTLSHPMPVRLGKRGAESPAIGIGDMVVSGAAGRTVLRGVLHVPDLAVSLLSVEKAVRSGMAVMFMPQPHGPARVLLQRDGRTVLTASERGSLFYIDTHPWCAAASAGPELAVHWHRRLGHLGFSTLADLARSGLIDGCPVTAADFSSAGRAHPCEPCALGKLRRVPHPARRPAKLDRLGRVHSDLCELPGVRGRYMCTFIDEATRYTHVEILAYKSDTAGSLRRFVAWSETQTGRRVQRVRHDRGGEYMNHELQHFCAERGIQREPTAGYSPEANGIAERHNLSVLDGMLPMLADSADPAWGLPPLGAAYAPDAAVYANDRHNATPSRSAMQGTTPNQGFLGVSVPLSSFHRFGSRVWVLRTGHRGKLQPRSLPGRFLGFARPPHSGIYRVLLDDGSITQSQTVRFSDAFGTGVPATPPAPPAPRPPVVAPGGGEDDSDSDEEAPEAAPAATPQAAQAPAPAPAAPAAAPPAAPAAAPVPAVELGPAVVLAQEAAAVQPGPAIGAAPGGAQPRYPVRGTRNPAPRYGGAPRAHAAAQGRPRTVAFAVPLETPWGVQPTAVSRAPASCTKNGEPTGRETGEQLLKVS